MPSRLNVPRNQIKFKVDENVMSPKIYVDAKEA